MPDNDNKDYDDSLKYSRDLMRQKIFQDFKEMRIVSLDDVIDELAYDNRVKDWIIATVLKYADQIPDEPKLKTVFNLSKVDSFQVYNKSTNIQRRVKRHHFDLIQFPKNYEKNPKWGANAKGHVYCSDLQINNIQVTCENSVVLFKIIYLAKLHLSIQELEKNSISSLFSALVPEASQFHKQFNYIYELEVPLDLLRLWIATGRVEDENQGIVLEHASKHHCRYQEYAKSYHVSFIRWFTRQKISALDRLKEADMLSEEVSEVLENRLHLRMQTSARTKKESEETSQALKISKKDRARLAIIEKHGYSQSYSQWAELLGYNAKSAAFTFLNKMDRMELVIIVKDGKSGAFVSLTEKGKSVLYALRRSKIGSLAS